MSGIVLLSCHADLLGQQHQLQSDQERELGTVAQEFENEEAAASNIPLKSPNRTKEIQAKVPPKESDEKFSYKFGGQMVMDMLWFSQPENSRQAVGDANDVFDFRRARLYVTGDLQEHWSYAMGFDFGQGSGENGRPVFLDNYIALQVPEGLGKLRIGHFFEPFTLERSGSNRNTMFMERSLVDMFAPSRNLGIMLHDQSEDESLWWGLGTFRGSTDNFGDDAGDQLGQTIDARLVIRPWNDSSNPDHYLHLGVAYSYRDAADGEIRYRTRPEASGNEDPSNTATPYFVDTGNLKAENSQLWGSELLWTHGSFSLQNEVVAAPVRLTSGENVMFTGYYVSAAHFLTGEFTPYNPELAITDRVKPLHPVFLKLKDDSSERGIGAWQLAVRLSNVDANDGSIAGGRLTNTTFGINWFLTPFHRMKFNYILSGLTRSGLQSKSDIFGLRFDMDF